MISRITSQSLSLYGILCLNMIFFLLEVHKDNSASIQDITLNYAIPTFHDLKEKAFEKIAGKGENAGNQHFLLFPQYFQPCQGQKSILYLRIFFFFFQGYTVSLFFCPTKDKNQHCISAKWLFSGVYLVSLYLHVWVSVYPFVYKILVILCRKTPSSFAAVVLKVSWYIDSTLKLCKMLFSTIYSLWLINYHHLELRNFLLNCLFLSKRWSGNESCSVTTL